MSAVTAQSSVKLAVAEDGLLGGDDAAQAFSAARGTTLRSNLRARHVTMAAKTVQASAESTDIVRGDCQPCGGERLSPKSQP